MSERGRVAAVALAGLALAALLGLAGYLVVRETIAVPASSLSAGERLAPPVRPTGTTARAAGRETTAAAATVRTRTATTARTSTTVATGTTADDRRGRGRGRGGDDRSGSNSGSGSDDSGRGRGRSNDD